MTPKEIKESLNKTFNGQCASDVFSDICALVRLMEEIVDYMIEKEANET